MWCWPKFSVGRLISCYLSLKPLWRPVSAASCACSEFRSGHKPLHSPSCTNFGRAGADVAPSRSNISCCGSRTRFPRRYPPANLDLPAARCVLRGTRVFTAVSIIVLYIRIISGCYGPGPLAAVGGDRLSRLGPPTRRRPPSCAVFRFRSGFRSRGLPDAFLNIARPFPLLKPSRISRPQKPRPAQQLPESAAGRTRGSEPDTPVNTHFLSLPLSRPLESGSEHRVTHTDPAPAL